MPWAAILASHRSRKFYEMTSQTNYGCGKHKHGVPTAGREHELRDGVDTLPEDWSDLRLQNFGTPTRAYFRHLPSCTARMIAIINGALA